MINEQPNKDEQRGKTGKTQKSQRIISPVYETSEQSLRNYVLAASFPLMILRGPNFFIEVTNQPQADLLHRPLETLAGNYLLDLLPEIKNQPFPALLKQVYDTGISYKQNEEVFYLDLPGGPVKKYVSFFYDAIRDAQGKINGLIVSAQDITVTVNARLELEESNARQQTLNEQVLATNAELARAIQSLTTSNEEIIATEKRLFRKVDELAESEARIRYMLDEAPVAICILAGRELIIESANNKMIEIWNKPRSVIGSPLSVALPEIQEQPFLQILDTVFVQGIPFFGNEMKATIRYDNILKDLYVNFVFQPIKNANQQTTSIIVVAIDITEQVNSKLAVADKNKKLNRVLAEFEFLANTVPAVVWTATPDGNLDYINQRWYDRSDIPISEALGAGWAGGLHPEDLPVVWERWRLSLSTGDPYQIEFRLADREGKFRWYLVRANPLRDEEGNIIKWYGGNTDITEQKEMQRQKDDFLGIASHELKTPVTSIKAYTQLLEMKLERAGDKENRLLAEKMDKQVNRLTSLIGDLLDVTKINSGRLQFNETVFDFNQMVNEVIDDISQTHEKHQIIRKLEFSGKVSGDRDRLWQVVTNLLTNAIKYSPGSNRIIVYTENKPGLVQLCIQDFGIGIREEKLDRVFEQFYRVSGTREHTFPGLGLGLYISSEIVKRLGGRIWVDSVEGKGSTFCFTISTVTG